MQINSQNSPPLPSLNDLGKDLLLVSRVDVAVSLLRPIVCFVAFWIFARAHLYILASLSVAGLMFFTYTSTSHDLVYRTLRLPNHLSELLLSALLVTLASWIFPMATVWWPHRAEGLTPLQQTRSFRGRIVLFLFFQHTYHLEHHLYPGVCSHRWAELGRRLEPHLLKAGVEFVRLP